MAWIESHQELARHPKTLKAAALLQVSVPQMVGHLHMLWWWAMDYAKDGDLSDFDHVDIALAAAWEGDPQELVDALVGCGPGASAGFLEDTSGLRLHDWDEYGGKLEAKRRADAARKRAARAVAEPSDHADQDTATPSDARPSDVRGTSDGHDEDDRGTSQTVLRTAQVEEKRGEERTGELGGAAAPADAKTSTDVEVLQVDGFDDPVPVQAPAGELTGLLCGWAVEQQLADDVPRDPPSRARIAVGVLSQCVGDPAPQRAPAKRPTQAVLLEFVAAVTGADPPRELWGHVGRLLASHPPGEILGGLATALDAGAGLTGGHVDDPLALSKYATAVIRGQHQRGAA